MNEPLSKKELNALMNIAFKSKPGDKMLSPEESDALSEIVSIAVNSAATALSVLVDGNAAAENINVAYISSASLSKRYHKTLFVSEISFIKGLEGKGALIVGENDVVEISSLLAPEQDEDGASGTLNDFSVQLSDAVSQALSSALKRPIGVSAAPFSAMDYEKIHALLKNEDILIITSFGLKVKEGSYRIEILAPLSLGRRILDCMYYLAEKLSSGETGNGLSENNTAKKDSGQEDKIDVSPVKFQEFDIDADSEKVPDNIDIIMDVPMTVTVELGKTYKPIREILKITNGSIIGLDKLVGEPVDILVNGKQIAKGEVVVIDENFGVRINDIISAKSRLQKLC